MNEIPERMTAEQWRSWARFVWRNNQGTETDAELQEGICRQFDRLYFDDVLLITMARLLHRIGFVTLAGKGSELDLLADAIHVAERMQGTTATSQESEWHCVRRPAIGWTAGHQMTELEKRECGGTIYFDEATLQRVADGEVTLDELLDQKFGNMRAAMRAAILRMPYWKGKIGGGD